MRNSSSTFSHCSKVFAVLWSFSEKNFCSFSDDLLLPEPITPLSHSSLLWVSQISSQTLKSSEFNTFCRFSNASPLLPLPIEYFLYNSTQPVFPALFMKSSSSLLRQSKAPTL